MAKEYIERETALDALCKASIPTFSITGKPILDVDYVPAINSIPAADVAPVVRGQWIDAVLPNDNGGLPVQVCDQCNTFFSLAYTGGGHRFCPNCGADMREVQDDN